MTATITMNERQEILDQMIGATTLDEIAILKAQLEDYRLQYPDCEGCEEIEAQLARM